MTSARPVVAAVILAAGSGTRFGSLKQLAAIDGRPLLQHVVETATDAGLDEIVVVVGHRAQEVAGALELPDHGRTVENPDHRAGMSTSLRAGLDALGPDVEAAVILLGDQPTVSANAVRSVLEAHLSSPQPITRARYGTASGHPVVLGRSVWAEAAAITGDRGARDLLAGGTDRVAEVAIEGSPPPDVDTPDDHEALRRRHR